jgi:hypothetical protein
VTVDVLIDDEMDLPKKLAGDPMHGVVRLAAAKAKKKKR